jgi:hypothetical protein
VASESTRPVVLLADPPARRHHYDAAFVQLDWDLIENRDDALSPVDLVIVTDEWNSAHAALVTECRRRGTPSLHVVDGIIEWKNTFENPRSETERDGMPLFQPVLSDKIACLGRAQARILEAWGNSGKCEIVGATRFDARDRPQGHSARPSALRLLVTTATTPYFTERQKEIVLRSLHDLHAFFRNRPVVRGRRVEVVWRLPDRVRRDSGLEGAALDYTGRELAETLQTVDAAIVTPSTCLLEAMLAGVPVALLDYLNTPHFVPAAWSIWHQKSIPSVVDDLILPSQSRMLFQDVILHDQLECRSPARPRLIHLMKEMIQIGRECRLQNRDLAYPPRIVDVGDPLSAGAEGRARPDVLHPHHPVFRERDTGLLTAEVGHLRKLLRQRQTDIADRDTRIADLQKTVVSLHSTIASLNTKDSVLSAEAKAIAAVLTASTAGRRLIVWGAGRGGQVTKGWLDRLSAPVSCFVDSAPARQAEKCLELSVMSPDVLKGLRAAERPFVVIGSAAHAEIGATLVGLGYRKGQDFLVGPQWLALEASRE